jgi:hypothetical protein
MSSLTSSRVDIVIPNNATWEDAFQFGDTTDTTWDLAGQKFRLDIKGAKTDVTPLISLTSDAGQIVVDDVTQRIIHMNVPDASIEAFLPPGEYYYDLIMYDTAVPPIRVQLMHGEICVQIGITGD